MNYKETQYGRMIIVIFLVVIGFILLLYLTQWGSKPIHGLPFIIMEGVFIFLLLIFYKMSVIIGEGTIRIIYGIGLIRIKVDPDRFYGSEAFSIPWYYGIGIRVTPKGIQYNVQGLKAVRFDYDKNGKKRSVIIGTRNPQRLKTVIDQYFSAIKSV